MCDVPELFYVMPRALAPPTASLPTLVAGSVGISPPVRFLRPVAPPPPPPAPIVPKTQEEQLAEFFEMATSLGFSVTPTERYEKEIGLSIATRLRSREGTQVYQTLTYPLQSIPRRAAEQIFPECLVTEETPTTKKWEATTYVEACMFLPRLLSRASDFYCAGLTRGLKTESERVIRVLAVPIPTIVFEHAMRSGLDRLYAMLQYVLVDETGELHPPKDENRNEIALSPDLEAEVREQLFADLNLMGEKNFPLSPELWRQLENEDRALETEAMLDNVERQRMLAAAELASAPPGARKRAVRAERWEVDCILEERPSGRRRFRVRWEGYHPSWERWRVPGLGLPGEPLQTWEPLKLMRDTEALQQWRGGQ